MVGAGDVRMNHDLCPRGRLLGRLVLTVTISISSAGCRASSSGTWDLCFWKGTWSLLPVLKGSLCFSGWQGLVVHTPPLPVHPVTSAVWNGCHKSQIHPLESWEKSQGLPACDPDKTRAAERKNPAFLLVKDQILPSNPSVVVRDLWAWRWCPTGATPSDPPGPSGTCSPAWSISPP